MSAHDDITEPSVILPSIPGVDSAKGIAMTGGTLEGYVQVLSMFRKDTEERLQKLRYYLYESMLAGNGLFPEKYLSVFITQVHALKSASGTIGAADISTEADNLEDAAKAGDFALVQKRLPDFVEHLAELAKNIRVVTDIKPEVNKAKSSSAKKGKNVISAYIPVLRELINALNSVNLIDIDTLMEKMDDGLFHSMAKENLEHISDQILMAEFKSAIKSIEELIANN